MKLSTQEKALSALMGLAILVGIAAFFLLGVRVGLQAVCMKPEICVDVKP